MDNEIVRNNVTPAGRLFSLRHYLVALVLTALLPTLALVAMAVWQAGSTLRTTSTNLLVDSARTMAGAIERELDSSAALLETIALYGAGPGTLPSGTGGRLLVVGASPSPAHDRDTGTPTGLPEGLLQEVRDSGTPVISDLFFSPEDGKPQVAIIRPAPVAEDPHRLLALAVSPQQLIQALQRQGARLTSGILVAVTDGSGHIVARSIDAERVVGRRAPDWDALVALGTNEGIFNAISTEGVPVYFGFSKLRNARGWTVVVGEPRRQFDARWKRPMWSMAAASGISLLLVLLATGGIARRIVRPVKALADNGRRVIADIPVDGAVGFTTPILEFEDLRQSLRDAEAVLRQRAEAERQTARELAISERRYRSLAQVGALVFWRRTPDGRVQSATGWEELTGRPEEEARNSGWRERVHPEDQAAADQAWAAALAGERDGIIDVEFRVRTASDTWHWVRARAAPMRDENNQTVEWAGVLEDVNERRQAQAHIAHMAHHDVLTGLPNRLLFGDRLREAFRYDGGERSSGVALMWVDLDRFKEVNDTLGHASGDQVLRAVADRITSALRDGDTVARLGGDEFAVIQAQGNQPAAASALAVRLTELLGQPFMLADREVQIGVSIGIALPRDGASTPDELMQQADMALYRAKAMGRGKFCFYEKGMSPR
ncbi:MAG TPA: diguanylate cyclase [Steroidobacteraceae bacterium]|nr:diguanylate cyclase [Steroidobacteraceae bacterium]